MFPTNVWVSVRQHQIVDRSKEVKSQVTGPSEEPHPYQSPLNLATGRSKFDRTLDIVILHFRRPIHHDISSSRISRRWDFPPGEGRIPGSLLDTGRVLGIVVRRPAAIRADVAIRWQPVPHGTAGSTSDNPMRCALTCVEMHVPVAMATLPDCGGADGNPPAGADGGRVGPRPGHRAAAFRGNPRTICRMPAMTLCPCNRLLRIVRQKQGWPDPWSSIGTVTTPDLPDIGSWACSWQ